MTIREFRIQITAVIILLLINSAFTMLLWNAVIPDVLGLSAISFKQAIFIWALARFIIHQPEIKRKPS